MDGHASRMHSIFCNILCYNAAAVVHTGFPTASSSCRKAINLALEKVS